MKNYEIDKFNQENFLLLNKFNAEVDQIKSDNTLSQQEKAAKIHAAEIDLQEYVKLKISRLPSKV